MIIYRITMWTVYVLSRRLPATASATVNKYKTKRHRLQSYHLVPILSFDFSNLILSSAILSYTYIPFLAYRNLHLNYAGFFGPQWYCPVFLSCNKTGPTEGIHVANLAYLLELAKATTWERCSAVQYKWRQFSSSRKRRLRALFDPICLLWTYTPPQSTPYRELFASDRVPRQYSRQS